MIATDGRNDFVPLFSYTAKGFPCGLKFYRTDSEERLLVLVAKDGNNAVHVTDHESGGKFIRCLDTGTIVRHKPRFLKTAYRHRVWIGCHVMGDGVVVVDL